MFEIIVGNIGTVYRGNNFLQASSKFAWYVKQSKANIGRAAGEDVTFLHDDAIRKEYIGELSRKNTEDDHV
jgi:hypothetical protein